MSDTRKLIKKIEAAQDCCLKLATDGEASYEDYENHRSKLMSESLLKGHLPSWLVQCRYGAQYWYFIKKTSPHYSVRREFIWEHFGKLLVFVDNLHVEPTYYR